jgi:preprotein translocase subunit SecE
MATQRRAGSQRRQRKTSSRSGAARPNVDAARQDQSPDSVTSSAGAGSVAVAPRRRGRGPSDESTSAPRSGQRERGGSARAAWSARSEGFRKVIADTRSELRRVNWPDKETTQNLTLVVIAISIALGFLLGGIDYVLFQLFEALT